MKSEHSKVVEGTVIENDSAIKKTAVNALKKGTLAARRAAVDVAILPVKLVNHTVYGVCYGLAYGAVYGALVLGKAFPVESVVRKGLHEGLETAIKKFDAKHQEKIINTDSASVDA
jgi:hypothetical protein